MCACCRVEAIRNTAVLTCHGCLVLLAGISYKKVRVK